MDPADVAKAIQGLNEKIRKTEAELDIANRRRAERARLIAEYKQKIVDLENEKDACADLEATISKARKRLDVLVALAETVDMSETPSDPATPEFHAIEIEPVHVTPEHTPRPTSPLMDLGIPPLELEPPQTVYVRQTSAAAAKQAWMREAAENPSEPDWEDGDETPIDDPVYVDSFEDAPKPKRAKATPPPFDVEPDPEPVAEKPKRSKVTPVFTYTPELDRFLVAFERYLESRVIDFTRTRPEHPKIRKDGGANTEINLKIAMRAPRQLDCDSGAADELSNSFHTLQLLHALKTDIVLKFVPTYRKESGRTPQCTKCGSPMRNGTMLAVVDEKRMHAGCYALSLLKEA